jgi:hypothetical protein
MTPARRAQLGVPGRKNRRSTVPRPALSASTRCIGHHDALRLWPSSGSALCPGPPVYRPRRLLRR